MSLVPITIDEVRSLRGVDRAEALRLYHKWLEAERKNDKKELYNLKQKIYRFKRAEDWREYRKEYYRRNKDKFKKSNKKYYQKIKENKSKMVMKK